MYLTLNWLEAGLWCLGALVFTLVGIRRSDQTSRRLYVLAIAFTAVGVCAILEAAFSASWGPWWQPLWLSAAKAISLGILVWHLCNIASLLRYYVFGALIWVAAEMLISNPTAYFCAMRIAWELAPWSSLPVPYYASDFDFYTGPVSDHLAQVLTTLPLGVASGALIIVVYHTLTFFLMVQAHARFGSPKYWPDIRQRLCLRSLWADGIRRTWWVWPAVQALWGVWMELASAFDQIWYPAVNTTLPFLYANLALVALLFFTLNSATLRKHIRAAIGPDDLRCVTCGYLLRALTSDRCPECGRDKPAPGVVDIRLGWEHLRFWRAVWLPMRTVLALILALAPWLVPAVLVTVPREWLRYVPNQLQPRRQALDPDYNRRFPLRLDGVCVIKGENGLAVLLLEKIPERPTYHVRLSGAFWASEYTFGTQPPDSITVESDTGGQLPFLRIGPWQLSYGWGSENVIWLFLPSKTRLVTLATKGGFDGDLTWAAQPK